MAGEDVIVGNPPFVGNKMMRGELGIMSTVSARATRAKSQVVPIWCFTGSEKARAQIVASRCEAAALVATNSIRGGANRKVLDRIVESTRIFEAWSDEPWINEGAAVRVSLLAFAHCSEHLDHASLTVAAFPQFTLI